MIKEFFLKGQVIKESDIIDDLDIKFTIDKTNQKRIIGIIKGTKLKYDLIEKFVNKLNIKDSSFSIKGITEYNQTAEAKKCYFTSMGISIIPEKKIEIEKDIATVEADDFTLESEFEEVPKEDFSLTLQFFFDTRGILNQISSPELEHYKNKSIKSGHKQDKNAIETSLGQMKFYRRYIHTPITYKQREGLFRYYICVGDFEIKSVNLNNYEEKIEEAKEIIDDFLYLISTISRKAITWHQCTAILSSKENKFIKDIDYFQQSSYQEEYYSRRDDFIIDPIDLDKFLRIAYSGYKKHKDTLKPILGYYITSQEEKLLSSSFLMLFIVLEALVHQFTSYETKTTTIDRNQFKELCSLLKPTISEFCAKEEIEEDSIIKKLPELQRAPLMAKLESLIQKYNIFIDDLYPKPEYKFKFYKIRNELIHKGKISDNYELFKEKLKLQFLAERIILRILGWERKIYSTSDYPSYRFES